MKNRKYTFFALIFFTGLAPFAANTSAMTVLTSRKKNTAEYVTIAPQFEY